MSDPLRLLPAGQRRDLVPQPRPVPPVVAASRVKEVNAVQMAEVDRLAIGTYRISLPQMTEQVGSHLAELASLGFGGELAGRTVIVAVGPGHNGCGVLVAAPHLVNRGAGTS